MRLSFVAPWVVLREGFVRAEMKALWVKPWLAGDVATFAHDAPALRERRRPAGPTPGAEEDDGQAGSVGIVRFTLVRRAVQPLWATRWIAGESPAAAGAEKLAPAPSRTAERTGVAHSASGDARGKADGASPSPVSRHPWVMRGVIMRAALRAGIELTSANLRRLARILELATRGDVADVRVRVDELERRLKLFEKTQVA